MSFFDSYYNVGTYAANGGTAPTPGAADYKAGALALSPEGFWDLQDASGNAADTSGNGWHGVANGTPLYAQTGPTINGESLNAISFDGATDYFDIAATGAMTQPSATGFTITAWVKAPSDAGSKRMVFYDASGSQGCFYLRKGKTAGYGVETVTVTTTDTVHGQAVQPSDDFDDTWTFIAGRYDVSGGILRTWYNAQTFDDTSFTGTWKRDGAPTGIHIGFDGTGLFWDGDMALIGYWTTPLTDAQMVSLRTGVF